jgi:hypothetical protein
LIFTGTIRDLDSEGLFELISADDGRVLPFNLRSTPPLLRALFDIGTRVEFIEQESGPVTRAVSLVPIGIAHPGGRFRWKPP